MGGMAILCPPIVQTGGFKRPGTGTLTSAIFGRKTIGFMCYWRELYVDALSISAVVIMPVFITGEKMAGRVRCDPSVM